MLQPAKKYEFMLTNETTFFEFRFAQLTTLKEFALRAIYRLTFGENSTIARSLGQNDGQLIYVRKQMQLTEFGKIILKEICLPQDLQRQRNPWQYQPARARYR